MSDEWVDVLLVRTVVFGAGCSNSACTMYDDYREMPCDLPGESQLAGKIPGTGSCGWGYGQCDEPFAGSDCNRARDHMYRAYDMEPPPEASWEDRDRANTVKIRVRRSDLGKLGPNVHVLGAASGV